MSNPLASKETPQELIQYWENHIKYLQKAMEGYMKWIEIHQKQIPQIQKEIERLKGTMVQQPEIKL